MSARSAGFVVLFALLACKNQKQAYAEAKPAADALRAKVVSAAKLVEAEPPPPAGSTCKSSKKLTFNPKSDAHDTDYIMFQEAKRGSAKEQDSDPKEDLDLIFTGPMTQLLRGTNGYYPDYVLRDPAKDEMLDALRRGKNVKNVIMVRSHGTSLDYFLIDLATPSIVCKGTFDAEADPNLGTRTENYDLVKRDKRTGKELSRESKTETHDDRGAALFTDGRAKLRAHMKAELQLDAPE